MEPGEHSCLDGSTHKHYLPDVIYRHHDRTVKVSEIREKGEAALTLASLIIKSLDFKEENGIWFYELAVSIGSLN